MTIETSARVCPVCREALFAEGAVVLCSKCDATQHQRCWARTDECGATPKCKGRPQPVAVVRLEPARPTASEIAAAVQKQFRDVLDPLVFELRSSLAHGEDVEKLRRTVRELADAAQERLEAFRRDVDTRFETLRVAVADLERRPASTPLPVVREDVERAAGAAAARAEQAIADLRASVAADLAALRRSTEVDLHGILVAVEACRWDTAARRQPLPWDTRSDDVLDPPARASGEQQP